MMNTKLDSSVRIKTRIRLDYALASISCEHCRSSRNNTHYVPRHIIYYYTNILQKMSNLDIFEKLE